MGTIENRRSVRRNHDSILELYDAEGHFITGIGRLVNFSDVGVCFSSAKRLEKGDRLRAKLRLLKDGALELSARVVWVKKKPHGRMYGLEFDTVQKFRS